MPPLRTQYAQPSTLHNITLMYICNTSIGSYQHRLLTRHIAVYTPYEAHAAISTFTSYHLHSLPINEFAILQNIGDVYTAPHLL